MQRGKLWAVAFLLLLGTGALADPPPTPKTFWRNSNYFGHYVLFDAKTNTYVETVNCKTAWRFTRIAGGGLNDIYLRDASRKMNMRLSYDGMYLKADSDAGYKLYQRGSFDKRVRFYHQVNGTWTGTISRKPGCAFEELLAGSHTPNYFFVNYSEDANNTFLFDGSRTLRVRLGLADMFLQENGKPMAFFKKGYWGEN